MPPMLHVAFYELPCGGAQQLLAQARAFRNRQRHRVLELIAKAERTACLIEARARPQPTGECLVEKPAVDENIQ